MKVFLFVLNGAGQPVARWRVPDECHRDVVAECMRTIGWLPDSAAKVRGDNSRWWLVECESAESGRRAIERGGCVRRGDVGARVAVGRVIGRILASGGRTK